MNPRTLYNLSGIVSVIAGLGASLCLINIHLMFFALLLAIAGFLTSGLNIFLNARHEYSKGNFSIGYIGMIFSSLPVLFLLFIVFRHP